MESVHSKLLNVKNSVTAKQHPNLAGKALVYFLHFLSEGHNLLEQFFTTRSVLSAIGLCVQLALGLGMQVIPPTSSGASRLTDVQLVTDGETVRVR